jgi:Protein of unknown function (DUF1570)
MKSSHERWYRIIRTVTVAAALLAALALVSAAHSAAQAQAPPSVPRRAAGKEVVAPPPPAPSLVSIKPASNSPPAAGLTKPLPEARRIRVRDRSGKTVVTRVHGGSGEDLHVMLPDGHLGMPQGLAYTDEEFVPATAREVADKLLAGPFAGFKLKMTSHYVLVYQCTDAFAESSAQVLEDLYKSLLEAFKKRGFPVHETEFPLVAVIFKSEKDLRAYRKIDPQIRAYYEIYSNRIVFYETSESDEAAPEVAALRRPQTVAHEGTHQILANIGIQPRLAVWPPWLIEGLAEYCAAPVTTRRGTNWSVLGAVNSQHIATIKDLSDPLTVQIQGPQPALHIGRAPGQPLVEYLVTKADLTPTDYALCWALTHYLGMKRVDNFVSFLKTMSEMPPLESRTAEDHLDAFRAAFGKDLQKLDREVDKYLGKLKVTNPLPYYAVMFQQHVPGNQVKRAAMVSQSPSMIRQWLETNTAPAGDLPAWEAVSFKSRIPAVAAAQAFVHGQ